jgi:hypothetical protein
MRSHLVRDVVHDLVQVVVAAVGDPDAVPNVATPDMLTAGPRGSLAGAARLLRVYWARVSLTVRGVSVRMLPMAIV